MTPEQLEIMAHIRIIELSGERAFYLYQDGKISLSKLLALIAETLTDEGYGKVRGL